MKLFMSPGACSLGIHVLLEEIGKPYEVHRVAFAEGEQYKPAFLAVSPKSKVPALARDDGSVLTEYGAIATWLARTNPQARLLPADADAEGLAVEAMDYIVATVHMQGFTRIARPTNFNADPAQSDAVKARGREIYGKGLQIVADRLGDREWVAGDYSVGDSALFYVSNWSKRAEVALPPPIQAHFDRMKARPAVQRTMAAEGLPL